MMEFKYFKSVPGKLVTRFGTKSLIGAEVIGTKVESGGRFAQTETDMKWSDEAVAIPSTEIAQYRREYARCIREGSLIEVQQDAPSAPIKSKVSKDK